MARANMRIRRRRQKPTEPLPTEGASESTSTSESGSKGMSHSESERTDAARTRAEINRANARHSTGPKTEAGKARSSQNAFRHGLFSQRVVLPGEDPQAFAELRAGLRRTHAPMSDDEELLVERMAITAWRRQRYETAVSEVFLCMLAGNADAELDGDPADGGDRADDNLSPVATWAARIGFEKALALVDRLSTREERAHKTARLELARLQRERLRQQRLVAECLAAVDYTTNTGASLFGRELTSVLLAGRRDADRVAHGYVPIDASGRVASFSRPGSFPAAPALTGRGGEAADEVSDADARSTAGCGIA